MNVPPDLQAISNQLHQLQNSMDNLSALVVTMQLLLFVIAVALPYLTRKYLF